MTSSMFRDHFESFYSGEAYSPLRQQVLSLSLSLSFSLFFSLTCHSSSSLGRFSFSLSFSHTSGRLADLAAHSFLPESGYVHSSLKRSHTLSLFLSHFSLTHIFSVTLLLSPTPFLINFACTFSLNFSLSTHTLSHPSLPQTSSPLLMAHSRKTPLRLLKSGRRKEPGSMAGVCLHGQQHSSFCFWIRYCLDLGKGRRRRRWGRLCGRSRRRLI